MKKGVLFLSFSSCYRARYASVDLFTPIGRSFNLNQKSSISHAPMSSQARILKLIACRTRTNWREWMKEKYANFIYRASRRRASTSLLLLNSPIFDMPLCCRTHVRRASRPVIYNLPKSKRKTTKKWSDICWWFSKIIPLLFFSRLSVRIKYISPLCGGEDKWKAETKHLR